MQNFENVREVGAGSFGRVMAAELKLLGDNLPVALKLLEAQVSLFSDGRIVS